MPIQSCPNRETLQHLLTGTLHGSEADQVEEHLLGCQQCLQVARTVPANDDLVAVIRTRRELSDHVGVLDEAIEQAKQLHTAVELSMALWSNAGFQIQETKQLHTTVELYAAAELEEHGEHGEPKLRQPFGADEIDFLLPPQQADELGRLGDYRVLEVLGVGGMGIVFRAEDPKLQRQIALKVMKPTAAASRSAKNRFIREAQATAAIDHDNIVQIYQVGEDRQMPFIAMQFLRGESLQKRLQRADRLDEREVVRIGRDVAAGLAAAHQRGLVHRDIKPDNIWLDEAAAYRAKILDFGLVRMATGDDGLTQSGMVLGTPRYMAPEQAKGEAVDHRSDLFSLGAVLYHLASGKPPFECGNLTATLIAVSRADFHPISSACPDLHPDLAELITRLLSREKEARPQSAAEVADSLARIQRQLTDQRSQPLEPMPQRPFTPTRESGQPRVADATTLHAPAAFPTQPVDRANTRKTPAWIAAATVAAVFSIFVGLYFAGIILKVEAKDGTLTIKASGDDVVTSVEGRKIMIKHGETDEVFTIELDAKPMSTSLKPGSYFVLESNSGWRTPTDHFTIRSGETQVVELTWTPKTETEPARVVANDPDRRAAEWVILAGGRVRVNDQQRDLTNIVDLPSEDFVLTEIGFNPIQTEQMTDEGLALFEHCTGLKALHLCNPAVTDSRLAFFRNCKNLIDLRLPSTGVTDAGLAYFKGCTQLKNLDLRCTAVTDAGMVHFQDCKDLVELSLSETTVSDVGLANFNGCNQIASLLLEGTQVTDSGLAYFKDCKGLLKLNLHRTQVTDQGLAHFRNCPILNSIEVGGTRVTGKGFSHFKHCQFADLSNTLITDEGLAELAGLSRLVRVNLRNSQVTPSGIEAFKKVLPGCVIEWDGVVIEPGSTSSTGPKTVVHPPSAALEALRRDQISPEALIMAGDGDPIKAPANLVGVLGEVRPIQNDRIHGLAFSPDGRWLASASHDKTILLRDANTGRVSRVLRGHSGPVTSVVFSQDGKTLVSASHDSTLKLWSVEEVSEPETLQVTLGEVHTLAASLDGRFLAAGGTTGVIKLWKWGQWNASTELIALPGKIHALAFSPNGELLGSSEGQETDSRVRLYHTSDGKVALSWEAGTSPVNALAFHREGKWLATTGGSNFVRLWDVTSGKLVAEKGEWAQWGPLAFHPNGKSLYAFFPYETGLLLELPELNHSGAKGQNIFREPPVASVAYSPDGMNLAFGTPNGDVVIWDNVKWEKRLPQGGHSHYITGLAVSPDGQTVLSGGDENVLRRWDVSRPGESQIVQRFDCGLLDAVWSPDGKKFATIAAFTWYDIAQRGAIWDASTSKQIFRLEPLHQIFSGAFSPDGKWFAGCSHRDECVHLWDATTGKQVHQFPKVGVCLDRPAFSADGKLLAVATRETKTVKIWNVASGDEVHSWEDQPMRSIALSRDGRIVATGHFDGTISLWDLSSKDRTKRTLAGHSLAVNTLKFTPDGKTLVSSSDDGTIRVWNTGALRALREIISVGPAKKPLLFDLDASGQCLFAGGNSPLIYLLRLAPNEDNPRMNTAVSPDRRAAEWILSIGGKVRVNDNTQDDIVDKANLPSDGFRLTYIQLSGKAQVRDDDLAIFASCQDLAAIGLDHTGIGNAGVRPFANAKRLTHVYVQGTRINDEGLASFAGCKDLLALGLGGTRVTSNSIQTIRGFSKLQFLDVTKTKINLTEIENLGAALPNCKIVHDGGVINPRPDNHAPPQRSAREGFGQSHGK